LDRLRVLVVAGTPQVQEALAALILSSSTLELGDSVLVEDASDPLIEYDAADVTLWEIDTEQVAQPPSLWNALPLVIFLTPWHDAQARELLDLGAAAVLPRDAPPRQIEAAIHAAAADLIVVDRLSTAKPSDRSPFDAPIEVSELPDDGESLGVVEHLTPRELEILEMLAQGLGNKAVAARLSISEHTVKFHVGSILGKLGAASRGAAIATAIRRGWLMV
jgi:DNA-binding NarL/FixJ family response regulator